jgi:hypothetical protein
VPQPGGGPLRRADSSAATCRSDYRSRVGIGLAAGERREAGRRSPGVAASGRRPGAVRSDRARRGDEYVPRPGVAAPAGRRARRRLRPLARATGRVGAGDRRGIVRLERRAARAPPKLGEHACLNPLLKATMRRTRATDPGPVQRVPLHPSTQHQQDRVQRAPVRHPRIMTTQRMQRTSRKQPTIRSHVGSGTRHPSSLLTRPILILPRRVSQRDRTSRQLRGPFLPG